MSDPSLPKQRQTISFQIPWMDGTSRLAGTSPVGMVGWGNVSLAFGLPSHENFKLTTRGKFPVPLPQMVLTLTIPVQFLAEPGFH